MQTESFVAWALDDSRTRDERYTVEVLVEQGIRHWNSQRKIYRDTSFEESYAKSRERKLNPAYQPDYDEDGLRKTAESLADLKNWWPGGHAIVSLAPLRFFPSLEWVWIHNFGGTDLSPLTDLPLLRKLLLGPLGTDFGCPCADYTPLARCASLRELTLGFGCVWPDFNHFGDLQQLELLEISGNLLALPRGLVFPRVRRAKLYCRPLYARSVTDLPQLPACEFLTLQGVERLDGIEQMPSLRNLILEGHCESFAPLTALKHLTFLNVVVQDRRDPALLPRDVTPIAQLPELRVFQIGPRFKVYPDMPRDYLPLAEARALREIEVRHCPPVQMEVASIQAGLPPWDDVFLLETARPLGPLTLIIAPHAMHPTRREEQLDPDDNGLIDVGLREAESRWVSRFAAETISARLGVADWGEIRANAACRILQLRIESYGIVERLPEIVDATREVIARLRPDYYASFGIHLRIRPAALTPAQQAVEDRLQRERYDWESEEQAREQAEYLERLHEFELKKQQGLEIDPADFSPPPPGEYKPAKTPAGAGPADDEADQDEADFSNADYNDGDDDIAVAADEEPDVPILEDYQHPLAAEYLCAGTILLDEMWLYAHLAGIGCHLMQRQPDREIAEEPKPGDQPTA
jgi:hypothetical protein